jgi:hypothetical protein
MSRALGRLALPDQLKSLVSQSREISRGVGLSLIVLSGLALSQPTLASETITYAYDPLGRLVQASRAGTVNNGASEIYSYDRADNRTNVTATAAPSSTCSGISFSVANNGPVTEGASSVFTITKSGATSASCSVNYATAGGTAVAGSDYTATSGTLTFSSAQSSLTVSVATIDDTAVESAETFSMSLSNPTSPATIGTGTATATINDNDFNPCAGVTFTVSSNGAVTEGTTSAFTVTKSGSTSNSCSVNYATVNGTATAGSDYTAASGTLTFTSGQTSQTVNVATIDDTVVESAETFTLGLSSPTGGSALGSPSSATATINDNDAAAPCAGVSYVIGDASGVEGDTLVLTVTKSGSTTSSCSVNYATADGTATAPGFYAATSGTLTFTSAQTSLAVSVTTVDRGRLTGIKTMYVNLSSPTGGATISDSQGIGSISASGGGGCPRCL